MIISRRIVKIQVSVNREVFNAFCSVFSKSLSESFSCLKSLYSESKRMDYTVNRLVGILAKKTLDDRFLSFRLIKKYGQAVLDQKVIEERQPKARNLARPINRILTAEKYYGYMKNVTINTRLIWELGSTYLVRVLRSVQRQRYRYVFHTLSHCYRRVDKYKIFIATKCLSKVLSSNKQKTFALFKKYAVLHRFSDHFYYLKAMHKLRRFSRRQERLIQIALTLRQVFCIRNRINVQEGFHNIQMFSLYRNNLTVLIEPFIQIYHSNIREGLKSLQFKKRTHLPRKNILYSKALHPLIARLRVFLFTRIHETFEMLK